MGHVNRCGRSSQGLIGWQRGNNNAGREIDANLDGGGTKITIHLCLLGSEARARAISTRHILQPAVKEARFAMSRTEQVGSNTEDHVQL